MKKILLFGAGKSATCLIGYLIRETAARNWALVVAESNLSLAQAKVGVAPHTQAVAVQVEDPVQRDRLIRGADIVISLLPPALHILVAGSCVQWKKNLLTASYLDDAIRALEPAIDREGLLFICEMGLDPGIDHMSAMELIHRIGRRGGRIKAFRSHTGGLVSPSSDDNPWRYKISWNPRNVVLAGSAGARYREEGQEVAIPYTRLFEDCGTVSVDGVGELAWYPNRDSLSYIPVYGLRDASTFIRTTLRYPVFCAGWKNIVKAGLTDDQVLLAGGGNGQANGNAPRTEDRLPLAGKTFHEWSAPLLPYVDETNEEQYRFLGLFDHTPLPAGAKVSADVMQYLLEKRLAMRPEDKDMIVMLHEISYEDAGGSARGIRSSLVVHGDNALQTAMAKTVGLPLGIAAIDILEGRISLTGLHIPIVPEIYQPVLETLAKEGISFQESAG